MQTTAVYSYGQIFAEAVASLPLHIYRYTDTGKDAGLFTGNVTEKEEEPKKRNQLSGMRLLGQVPFCV